MPGDDDDYTCFGICSNRTTQGHPNTTVPGGSSSHTLVGSVVYTQPVIDLRFRSGGRPHLDSESSLSAEHVGRVTAETSSMQSNETLVSEQDRQRQATSSRANNETNPAGASTSGAGATAQS